MLDAYERMVTASIAAMREPRVAETELPKAMVGEILTRLLGNARQDMAENVAWDGSRAQYESIDVRVESLGALTAVVRVCERISGTVRRRDNGAAVPELSGLYVSDSQYTFVLSERGWVAAKGEKFETVEGKSRCADGR